MVEARFGNRIMFGSDQMVWPRAIERAVAFDRGIAIPFAQQKRDILFNNAARFLRLTPKQIEGHQKPGATAP